MKRILFASLAAMLMTGCASPLDERWYLEDDPGARRGELPRWVLDEWETSQSAAADSSGSSDRSVQTSRNSAEIEGHRNASPESLDDLIIWALKHNPSVQAAEARWHAARQRIVQASTLPEPELSYRVIVEQADTDRSPIGHAVGISQMFPWFGTLDRAADVQAAEARAAAQRYVQQQLAIVSAIKTAWAEYAYLHQAASVYREQKDLLQQIESVVRSLFRTGEVGQRDFVRVEAEIDRVDNDLRDAEEMIVVAAAQLNAAIGRRSGSPLPEGEDASVRWNDGDAFVFDEEELFASLVRVNPELERLRHELAGRRHAKQLAEKQFYPDIMLGIEYGVNTSKRMAGMDGGGTDMLTGRIGVTLPIWRSSYEAGVREAMAGWGATLRDLDDRQNQLEAELKMIIYGIRDAQRRTELFGHRLRIRAEQVLESTTTAYRTGDASFTDLIEAQRELLEFSLAAERAEADRFRQIARLEELVGKALDTPDAGGAGRVMKEDRP